MESQSDQEDDAPLAQHSAGSNGDAPESVHGGQQPSRFAAQRPELPARQPRPAFPWAILLVMFLVAGMCLLLALLSQGLLLPLGFVAGGIVVFCALHYLVWGWWLGAAIRREEEEDQ